MSQILEVQALKLSQGKRHFVGFSENDTLADIVRKEREAREIQWSERVRALLLAQPLNPLQTLEFKPL